MTFRDVADAFDPARLIQARRLAAKTKRAVAQEVGVSAVAVGQWESGAHPPRPDHVAVLANALDVEPAFLSLGRPHARLDTTAAHFRSLRRTPASERARAIAFVEQVWELAYALEKRIELPAVHLPGFSAGEINRDVTAADPREAAREVRKLWHVPPGRIPKLVRLLERHGVIITLVPFAGAATATVDAFSTSQLPRPVIILTPDRANDVYRHRFTAAHELGHLVLHPDAQPGDPIREREADMFAAEFLTPGHEIEPLLPARMDLQALDALSQQWGVAIESLVYRSREMGVISETAYRRAFQRINQLRKLNLFQPQPVTHFLGEVPALLKNAYSLACDHGLTMNELADEVRIKPARIRLLLGLDEQRPRLQVV